jgi:hypothetical protein
MQHAEENVGQKSNRGIEANFDLYYASHIETQLYKLFYCMGVNMADT